MWTKRPNYHQVELPSHGVELQVFLTDVQRAGSGMAEGPPRVTRLPNLVLFVRLGNQPCLDQAGYAAVKDVMAWTRTAFSEDAVRRTGQ